jgi:hypothetical protein
MLLVIQILEVLEPVKLNDHRALGVIFAKNLKRGLSKQCLENKDTECVSILPRIIEQYNNTSHTALDNVTPNQAISTLKNVSMSCILKYS